MKVAYVFDAFPSRSETFALRELGCLAERGWQITVFAAACDPGLDGCLARFETHYRPPRVSWRALSALLYCLCRCTSGMLRFAVLLVRIAAECPSECFCLLSNAHAVADFSKHMRRAGIGHVHAYFLSWPASIGLGVSKMAGCSFSISAHARDIFVESGAARLKMRSAQFVAACTGEGVKHLSSLVPSAVRNQLHLIRHGIDMRRDVNGARDAYQEKHEQSVAPMILAVGRLVPKKGFEHLVEAFSKSAAEIARCRLVLVGDGPQRDHLAERVRSLCLEDRVQLLGWRANPEVQRLMRRAIAVVVPSVIGPDGDRDGVPNVVLEAMANGTAVIASRLAGIMEAVEHERTGLLADPADVDGLAQALVRIVREEDLRNGVTREAKRMVAEQFDLDTNVARIAELLEYEVTRNR